VFIDRAHLRITKVPSEPCPGLIHRADSDADVMQFEIHLWLATLHSSLATRLWHYLPVAGAPDWVKPGLTVPRRNADADSFVPTHKRGWPDCVAMG
jgi:hypothetical protein